MNHCFLHHFSYTLPWGSLVPSEWVRVRQPSVREHGLGVRRLRRLWGRVWWTALFVLWVFFFVCLLCLFCIYNKVYRIYTGGSLWPSYEILLTSFLFLFFFLSSQHYMWNAIQVPLWQRLLHPRWPGLQPEGRLWRQQRREGGSVYDSRTPAPLTWIDLLWCWKCFWYMIWRLDNLNRKSLISCTNERITLKISTDIPCLEN